MHWRCSNENAAKKRHAHSAPTAFMAGSSVAFHIAANVWDSPVVGTLAIFDRARREVLDGTERLSSPLPNLEIGFRDRKSTRLNSSHTVISYAVFCLKK